MTKSEFLKLPMEKRRKILEWQAEALVGHYETIRLLEDRQSETLKKVWEALGISTYDEAKPLSMFEHIERLRERVRELESNEDTWRIKEVNITCDNLKQAARIRELEEAMPDVGRLRDYQSMMRNMCFREYHNEFKRMADRIEKVMRKEGYG